MSKHISSIWTRDADADVIDMHFDFEFVDLGAEGCPIISLGAVIETDDRIDNFYGVNTDFFRSKHMRNLLSALALKKQSQHENAKWLFDHVFKHVLFSKDNSGFGSLGEYVRSLKLADLLTFSRYGLPTGIVDEIDGCLGAWSHLADEISEDGSSSEFCTVTNGPVQTIANDLLTLIHRHATKVGIDHDEMLVRPIGYHVATDFQLLCNMFGNMNSMPKCFQRYGVDIRLLTDAYGLDHDNYDLDNPHHPLLDARAQRDSFNQIKADISNLCPEALRNSILGE